MTHAQFSIEDNILTLSEQINEIHEILTFAKIGIISRHILDNTEMNYVTEELNKNQIKIKSEEQIYSLLQLKAYYNKTDLVILIEIPQFSQDIYNIYKIKTYPINNYKIKQYTNTLLSNTQNYMLINQPCQTIEQVFYCQQEQVHTNNNSCIPNIINNKNANCNAIQTTNQDTIEFLHDEYLFIISTNGTRIQTTCEINNAIIKGIKLLHFQNCSITAEGKTFTNDQTRRIQRLQIIQPFDNIIINFTKEKVLDIPYLTMNTIKNLKEIHQKQKRTTTYAHTIATSTLITIIIIIIILFFLFKNYRNSIQKINQQFAPTVLFTKAKEAEDSSILSGEELCVINTSPIIDTPTMISSLASKTLLSASLNKVNIRS